ncbi:zinc finger, CCHC-type containing protein [Tanacetum coccineum]
MATAAMSVVYVLTTPIPEDGGDDPTLEQQIIESRKELWDSLEAKYMAKDASSKKFFVSNFTNYKITDSRPVMEQHNELFDFKHTLKRLKKELTLVELGSHLRIEESLRVQDSDKPKSNNVAGPQFCYVSLLHNKDEALDKLKVFKTEFELQQGSLIKRFRNDRGGLSQGFWGEAMLTACYLLNRVPNKKNMITPYEIWIKRKPNLNYLRVWGCRAVVRLPGPNLKTLGERGIECIFVRYAEHSKAFRFYVIEPNDSVSINSIIESRDAIFDENRFSSVPRPSLRIPNGTEDIGGSVVPEEVTKEVVQQPEPELRKSKRNRTPKDFEPEFQLYLIEGTRDEVSNQHSYCFNVENDLKLFDEAIKSQDVAFWKETINDEMDSIIGNNIWMLADLPPGCKPLGCKWIFKRKFKMDVKTAFLNGDMDEEVYMNQPQGFIMSGNENKVDLTKEFLSSKFSMKDMGRLITPMDTSEKLMPNNSQAVSQLEYSRVIGCLVYAMTCTRPDIAFVVGKLSRYTSNPGTRHWQAIQRVLKYLKKIMDYKLTYTAYPSVLKGYTDASWISNTEDNSSTSGWVFLLGGGAISWASKKQTCITSSTIEYEFMTLAAAGKEAEYAATLAKAYSQMYNGKSRHLGVRHSMIRKLITNEVISIEFGRSQQNLADHLTKGLARDLVIKSAKGMGLKSN